MKVLVTGATGFVGRHVVAELLSRGHDVVVVVRNIERAQTMPWYKKIECVACDIHDPAFDITLISKKADVLLHLAWPGLPNYKESFHVDRNYPADYRFITKIVLGGIKHVLITGTCLEYGMKTGALSEDFEAHPIVPYAIAKDKLRRSLDEFRSAHPFVFQWARLFYVYGQGQNPNSLLSQFERAIADGDQVFNMSGGEQQRDFLPIEVAAQYLVLLMEHPDCVGVVNCCSGHPISVRQLIETKVVASGATIRLNFGHYPYPDYEPMEFWGDRRRLNSILERL